MISQTLIPRKFKQIAVSSTVVAADPGTSPLWSYEYVTEDGRKFSATLYGSEYEADTHAINLGMKKAGQLLPSVGDNVLLEENNPLANMVLPTDNLSPESATPANSKPSVAQIVATFARFMDWRLNNRDRSFNRCKRTSITLVNMLRAIGYPASVHRFTGWKSGIDSTCHPVWKSRPAAEWTHYAVMVEGDGPFSNGGTRDAVIYDLTAQQFNARAPYPMIASYLSYLTNWTKDEVFIPTDEDQAAARHLWTNWP